MVEGGMMARNAKFSSLKMSAGLLLLSAVVLLAILAPLYAPYDSTLSPLAVDLDLLNAPPFTKGHLLGTDLLGRDILGQAMWGARASLIVGILAATIAVSFGSLWGAVSAFFGGPVDSLMMRAVDGLLSIPNIVLMLAINSFLQAQQVVGSLPAWLLDSLHVTAYSSGLLPLITVIFVISATTWLEAARIARARIKSVLVEEYVTAAKAIGVGARRMLARHLLPNAAPVIFVEATLLISDAVLMEAGLSYLGLGLGPATPSWGTMLTSAQESLIQGNWWTVLVPGLLITVTVMAVNLIGDSWLDATGGQGRMS
ncbi:MAG TPA: ABC transporter permease [Candidatus Obscuribacterales bacterium]